MSETPAAAAGEERVIKVLHPSLATYLRSFLLGVAMVTAGGAVVALYFRSVPPAVGWVAALLGVFLILRAVLLCRSSVFTITSLRVRRAEGILGRNTWETAIRDVRNVTVRQTLPERLFGIGTVEITSAGGPYVDVRFHGIREPHAVSELLWRLKPQGGPAGPGGS